MTGNSRPIPALQVFILRMSVSISISDTQSLLAMLESGMVNSLKEIAESEKIDNSKTGT